MAARDRKGPWTEGGKRNKKNTMSYINDDDIFMNYY
jgi:hypothetical protein